MKITRRQLRRIIREEVVTREYEELQNKTDDILDHEHPSDCATQEDSWAGGQNIHHQLDHSQASGGEPTTRGVEISKIVEEVRRLIRENWRRLEPEELKSEIMAAYTVPFIKTSEEFGSNPGGLWMSAEDPKQVGKNDFPLFDYYADEFDPQEKVYTMGVLKEFESFLADRGWYAEFYDGGTVMLWPL